jgi:uncharacterized protein HemY
LSLSSLRDSIPVVIPALLIAIVLLGLLFWVLVRIARTPKAPEHMREDRMADPIATFDRLGGPFNG